MLFSKLNFLKKRKKKSLFNIKFFEKIQKKIHLVVELVVDVSHYGSGPLLHVLNSHVEIAEVREPCLL